MRVHVDKGDVTFPKLKLVVTADTDVSAVLGTLSDTDVTLVSPATKFCTFDDSVTETPALSSPKLNFVVECDSELDLVPPHFTHFIKSLLFCTMQFGHFHEPDCCLNLSPNETASVDNEGNTNVDLVVTTDVLVSQA